MNGGFEPIFCKIKIKGCGGGEFACAFSCMTNFSALLILQKLQEYTTKVKMQVLVCKLAKIFCSLGIIAGKSWNYPNNGQKDTPKNSGYLSIIHYSVLPPPEGFPRRW